MDNNQKAKLLEELVRSLEIPESAYEKAISRYEDLGKWFDRQGSKLQFNSPHIFPQGSFRLGTAIKPINGNESYDLDLGCKIRIGISKSTHTQQQLKDLVGQEIETYRIARGIQAAKEEKNRCWRLEYADGVNFHMDIVPCIPESVSNVITLTESIQSRGVNRETASYLSNSAISITDKSKYNFSVISDDWQVSNPEGYANWFESKMSSSLLTEALFSKAQVDEVPLFKRKTALQKIIQILKRHRDIMFENSFESKPISVIITTLAAQSYSGTTSLEQCLNEVVNELVRFAESDSDEVLNPVNPAENFADKWKSQEYSEFNLKNNFHNWVYEVHRSFKQILEANDPQKIVEISKDRFAVNKAAIDWSTILGISISPNISIQPTRNITHIEAKPWVRR